MIILIICLCRSHDAKVGKQFYQQLKALRDALGLQFRFEVIFDDGSHLLSISKHFMKRLSKWGATPVAARTKTAAAATSGAGSPTEQALEGKGEREREGEGEGGRGRERGTPSYRRSRLRSDGSAKSCRSTGSGCSSSLGQTAVGGDGGIANGSLHSYKQLDHLPCVVVLAGSSRAGLSFPRYMYIVYT